MRKIALNIDNESLKSLRNDAAAKSLPEAGIAILALIAAANAKVTDPAKLAPANERLEEMADAFEANPPSTPEEIAAFAEQLRYMAQFTTTHAIPALTKGNRA